MGRIETAMLKHMEEIVIEERRAFSSADFRQFEYDGQEYNPAYGTIRNTFSKFRKNGSIKFQFFSGGAYYSLPDHQFSKEVTLARAGPIIDIGRQTPLYKWLKKRPLGKQSLHDIRITFSAPRIWSKVSRQMPNKINPHNKDIPLPDMYFSNEIVVKKTVHHSDIVSIAVSCSEKPIVIDIPDILYLIEILTRVETKIAATCGPEIAIPRYTNWTVKMWHFGYDLLDRYDGKEFQITFEEGISDLWRIYTKRRKDATVRIRVEHQEYPNEPVVEAILDKLFHHGEIK